MDQVEVSLNFLVYQYFLSISLHHKNAKGFGRHGFSYVGRFWNRMLARHELLAEAESQQFTFYILTRFRLSPNDAKQTTIYVYMYVYIYDYLYRYLLLTPTTAKVQKFIVHLQLFILDTCLRMSKGIEMCTNRSNRKLLIYHRG